MVPINVMVGYYHILYLVLLNMIKVLSYMIFGTITCDVGTIKYDTKLRYQPM
jgi:sulfite exporter TauE/SafE